MVVSILDSSAITLSSGEYDLSHLIRIQTAHSAVQRSRRIKNKSRAKVKFHQQVINYLCECSFSRIMWPKA